MWSEKFHYQLGAPICTVHAASLAKSFGPSRVGPVLHELNRSQAVNCEYFATASTHAVRLSRS